MGTTLTLPATPFTAADLGDTRDLRRLLGDHQVRRVLTGVYIRADARDSISLRAMAAARVVASHHVVVDRTAAWLHGVETYGFGERTLLPPVEVCALRGRNPTERRGLEGRSRDLAAADIMTVDGVKVTTPLRTALDLGCHLRRREAMAALNGFARAHGVTAEVLAGQLPRFRGRRGVVQLRDLVGLVEPTIESPRESWVWLEIHDAGLPAPTPQLWVLVDGVPTWRLDFAYEPLRICVEYDGTEAHASDPTQREHDDLRRAWLREAGWTVIVVRNGDFTGRALDRWLGELKEALRSAAYSTRRW